MTVRRTIRTCLKHAAEVHLEVSRTQQARIAEAARLMSEAIRRGRKLIWFGNGGSATQSQHMAAELVGRFGRDRRSLPSISLTENMASVTAIGNDYDYESIFARQMEGLGQRGDVAIGLSTSGRSRNVLAGLRKARERGLRTVGLTGASGDAMQPLCDVCILVPSQETARIQEAHLTIGHIFCTLIEDALIWHRPSASTR